MRIEDREDENFAAAMRPAWIRILGLMLLVLLIALPATWLIDRNFNTNGQVRSLAHSELQRQEQYSFNLENATIPTTEIFSGGPPKDGIPALSAPKVVSAEEAVYLSPGDHVVGVALGDQARAYPLRILNYHEIVNDELGGIPLAVTYCPLCDSVAVFDRTTPRGVREFGVSGLLYNSNVLIYDRDDAAESLWSQLKNVAITGPQSRYQLQVLPCLLTTWSDWQNRHPATEVLSIETGHPRDYATTPYRYYYESPSLMFPAQPLSELLPTKAKVLGVMADGKARAYPHSAFNAERRLVEDQLGGKRVTVEFDPKSDSLRVSQVDAEVEWMYSLWFAWYAMHPETEVYKPGP